MGCNCGKASRRRGAPPGAKTEVWAPALPPAAWVWRVLLPDGTVEDGYDEAAAVRRARDAGGSYEAVLPS